MMERFRSKGTTPKIKIPQECSLSSESPVEKQHSGDLSMSATHLTVSAPPATMPKPHKRPSNPRDQPHHEVANSITKHVSRHSIGIVVNVGKAPRPASLTLPVHPVSDAKHAPSNQQRKVQAPSTAQPSSLGPTSPIKPPKADAKRDQKTPRSVPQTSSQKLSSTLSSQSRLLVGKKAGQYLRKLSGKPQLQRKPSPSPHDHPAATSIHTKLFQHTESSATDSTNTGLVIGPASNDSDGHLPESEILTRYVERIKGEQRSHRDDWTTDQETGVQETQESLLDQTSDVQGEHTMNDDTPLGTPLLAPSLEFPLPTFVFEQESSITPHTTDSAPVAVDSRSLPIPGGTLGKRRFSPGPSIEYGGQNEEKERVLHEKYDLYPDSEDMSPSLEMLMKDRKPVDLSGQVAIPNNRPPAHGGLAIVYKGSLNGISVAVKILKIQKTRRMDAYLEASNARRVRREMNVWAALNHPNICEFLGYSTEFSDYPAMISMWCERGTAAEYLEDEQLSLNERILLTQDVGNGLHYLHQLKVIHGDLKPSNVLVDNTGVGRLCDFGLVRLADWEGPEGMTTTSPYTGTARYKAPELYMSSENRLPVASFEGDVYSLGCLMLEFIERVYPLQRFQTPYEVRNAIVDGYSPALRTESSRGLGNLTEPFWNLLETCWNEPQSRPMVSDIVDTLRYLASLTPSL